VKRLIPALACGAVLSAAGAALAEETATPAKAISLVAGQAVHYAGLTCTAYAGTRPTNADIVCVRDNLKGFGVVISQHSVIVAKRQTGGKLKIVFKAANG
jgi:hypothetical protein